MSGFSAVAEPTALLHPPKGETEYSLGFGLDFFNDAADLASPTYWVTEACNLAFGFNPLDEVLQWFTGDWESFSKCGEIWDQLGKAIGAVSTNIASGNRTLDLTWNGRAADAAYKYFYNLAAQLDDIKGQFDNLKDAYDDAAEGAYFAAKAISGFLGGITDGLLITAIELSAGTLLSWSGVGAAVGYGLAGLEIANMIRLWGEATSVFANSQALVLGAAGTIETAMGLISELAAQFTKVGEYDHPDGSI